MKARVKDDDTSELQQAVGNPYDHSIFIRQIKVWHGVDLEAKVDFWTRVWVCGGIYDPPQIVWAHNQDRYLPTAEHPLYTQDFGDGYVEVVEGGWLTFSAICTAIGPQWNPITKQHYQPGFGVQFQVWFEAVRPGADVRALADLWR